MADFRFRILDWSDIKHLIHNPNSAIPKRQVLVATAPGSDTLNLKYIYRTTERFYFKFMAREIHDGETIWSLVQAYAGLQENAEDAPAANAARVEGTSDSVNIIATPSGGAQTVRLELKGDWEKSLSDEDLLKEIKSGQK